MTTLLQLGVYYTIIIQNKTKPFTQEFRYRIPDRGQISKKFRSALLQLIRPQERLEFCPLLTCKKVLLSSAEACAMQIPGAMPIFAGQF